MLGAGRGTGGGERRVGHHGTRRVFNVQQVATRAGHSIGHPAHPLAVIDHNQRVRRLLCRCDERSALNLMRVDIAAGLEAKAPSWAPSHALTDASSSSAAAASAASAASAAAAAAAAGSDAGADAAPMPWQLAREGADAAPMPWQLAREQIPARVTRHDLKRGGGPCSCTMKPRARRNAPPNAQRAGNDLPLELTWRDLGNSRQLGAIRGNSRQFEAIRGN